MKSKFIIGLDIGGANLKVADNQGFARTIPFALWKESHRLCEMLKSIVHEFDSIHQLTVTMTGELCDCFLSKGEGVHFILDAVQSSAPGVEIQIWSTIGQFFSIDQAKESPLDVASANWHALATWCAGNYAPEDNALLIDIGSTTTDVIPLSQGKPVSRGLTDPARLAHGELIYTGVSRTPVCALLGSKGAAEFFATMADVYLILGDLLPDPDDYNTADGQSRTRENAHRRLARMICADLETSSESERLALARSLKQQQISLLRQGLSQVIVTSIRTPKRMIISGSGSFLAEAVLDSIDFQAYERISVQSTLGKSLADAACAYAVAMLAEDKC